LIESQNFSSFNLKNNEVTIYNTNNGTIYQEFSNVDEGDICFVDDNLLLLEQNSNILALNASDDKILGKFDSQSYSIGKLRYSGNNKILAACEGTKGNNINFFNLTFLK
jgi:hypothetical protein